MQRITIVLGLLLALLLMPHNIDPAYAQSGVEFSIRYNAGVYEVTMRPDFTPTDKSTLTAQVTIKVPTGTGADQFQPAPSPGASYEGDVSGPTWSIISTVAAPTEDTSADYISWNLNIGGDATVYNWTSGQEIVAFRFTNGGNCLGAVSLMDDSDPFNTLPNSAGTNPGNQIALNEINAGTANAYIGTYGSNSADCSLTDTDGDGIPDVDDLDDDNDGILDGVESPKGILHINEATNNTRLYGGNGDGTFNSTVTTNMSIADVGTNHQQSTFFDDVDGDGINDVLHINELVNNTRFYKGNADGTFAAAVTTSVTVADVGTDHAQSTFIGDADGDGISDILHINEVVNNTRFYKGNGDGTFAAAVTTSVTVEDAGTNHQQSTFFDDVDGDGINDVLHINEVANNTRFYKGNGNGTFAAAVTTSVTVADVGTDHQQSTFIEDVDGDGISDVLHINEVVNNTRFYKGNGDGTFAAAVTTSMTVEDVGTDHAQNTFIGDVDGDGISDILHINEVVNNTRFYKGNGDGTFAAATTSSISIPGVGTDHQQITFFGCVGLIDTDNDGIDNHLDLDSDNDGINDVIEAGGTDADGDGQADGAVDANGVPSSASGGFTPPNSDTDSQPDYLDLDSDNDTISDLIEGGSGGTDANDDGMVDGPETDGDGIMPSVDGDEGNFGDASSPALPDKDSGSDPNSPDYMDPVDDSNGGAQDIDSTPNAALDTNDDGAVDGSDTGSEGDPDGDGVDNVIDTDDANFGGLPTPTTATDTDGDGVPDSADADDDNDGILDTTESCLNPGIPNWSASQKDNLETTAFTMTVSDDDVVITHSGSTQVNYLDASSDFTGVANVDNGLSLTAPNTGLRVEPNDGVSPQTYTIDLDITPGDFSVFNLYLQDLDQSANATITALDGASTLLSTANWDILSYELDGTTPANLPNPITINASSVLVENAGAVQDTDLTRIRFDDATLAQTAKIRIVINDPYNGIFSDTWRLFIAGCSTADTDSDGIPNKLDLDSDNDGINDVIEAGGTDADGDGQADGAVDANGVPSSASGGLTPPNSDTDGQPDFLDLDSDNDTISDLVEGGSGGTDANDDGMVDGPETDGDGIMPSVDGDEGNFGDASSPALPDKDAGSDPNSPDYMDPVDDGSGAQDIDSTPNAALDTNDDGAVDASDTSSEGDPDGDGVDNAIDTDDANFGGLPAPASPDSDGDGDPDATDPNDGNACAYSTNQVVGNADAAWQSSDCDGDGVTNGQEVTDGTDPVDNCSFIIGSITLPVTSTGTGTLNYVAFREWSPAPGNEAGDVDLIPSTLADGPDGVQSFAGTTTTYYVGGVVTPLGINPNRKYSLRFTGFIEITEAATYTFWVSVDNRVKITINGTDVIYTNPGLSSAFQSGDIMLGVGIYPIDIGYFNSGANGFIDLEYESPTISRQNVPMSIFYACAPAPSPDSDGDGLTDDVDPDDDNDGLLDIVEDPIGDTDGDGIPDRLESNIIDTDGDGNPDFDDDNADDEGANDGTGGEEDGVLTGPWNDTDSDGIPDHLDGDNGDGSSPTTIAGAGDSDGDGIPDGVECPTGYICVDTDGDGIPNYMDTDSDGDGTPDQTEGTGDADNDGIPDYLDPDVGDDSGDTIPGRGDSDGDGLDDKTECPGGAPCPDSDGDGMPDYMDTDSDDDGIADYFEGIKDTDTDGIPDRLESNDLDTDDDGSPDFNDNNADDEGTNDGTGGEEDGVETGPWNDADGDRIPDHLDADSSNAASTPDGSGDSDSDGIPDAVECPTGYACADTDGDGTPNYMDTDSDGDGTPDGNAGEGATDDADNDGIPDYLDPDVGDDSGDTIPGRGDSDGDGIDDKTECPDGYPCPDSDGDGIMDYMDPDSDGDGIPDGLEAGKDTDSDGIPDNLEHNGIDTDGDGNPDFDDPNADGDGAGNDGTGGEQDGVETQPWKDVDGDGIPDHLDADTDGPGSGDSDNDGIPDSVECPTGYLCVDTDGDGVPNYMDTDSDNDGTTDGQPGEGYTDDADTDGIPDVLDPDVGDNSGDTIPGRGDSDGDGLDDKTECPGGAPCPDSDGDGMPDYMDTDSDDDGIADYFEGVKDTDADGIPDRLESNDLDTDDDGSPDHNDNNADGDGAGPDGTGGEEAGVESGPWNDTDGDNIPDHLDADVDGPGSGDSDADGIPDAVECPTGYVCADTDGDGTPNYMDTDSDGDGTPDGNAGEGATDDADNDGIPDYLDPDVGDDSGDTIPGRGDSDGDGIDDKTECPDGYPCPDSDGDGIMDYMDPDSDGDGIPDGLEAGKDTDSDGIPDNLEHNGIDTDGDGNPDFNDPNADGDGAGNDGTGGEQDGVETQPWKDVDGDGIPDHLDADTDGPGSGDSDNDGIPDAVECPTGYLCVDTDGDGVPNYMDTDSDNDGTTDGQPGEGYTDDADTDGIPDVLDPDVGDNSGDTIPGRGDSDGDGLDDKTECPGGAPCPDSDGDGQPDYMDTDSDGDKIPDYVEGLKDTDSDGIPDRLESNDLDTDGDGNPDHDDANADGEGTDDGTGGEEAGVEMGPWNDGDGDGIPDHLDADSDGPGSGDSDSDGIPDAVECPSGYICLDTDNDGIPNYMDTDSDNDGTNDGTGGESPIDDADNDGIPDYADPDVGDDSGDTVAGRGDSDGDGIDDKTECPGGFPCPDSDGDGLADYLDADSDNDGVDDQTEGTDDMDADGIPDRLESNTLDTDGDTNPDYDDNNADGEGANDGTGGEQDGVESQPWNDTDGDGIPDHLDADSDGPGSGDSDGDGLSDAVECPGGYVCDDTDGDGVPNYMDTDSDDDGTNDGQPGEGAVDDADNDGIPDFLDPDVGDDSGDTIAGRGDSDGDGIDDKTECPNGYPCPDSDGNGLMDYLDAGSIAVPVKVILQGAMEGATMRDDLRQLPAGANGFPLTSPYGGGETTTAGVLAVGSATDAIVDWVMVELRDGGDNTSVVAMVAGLVQRDGDVVSASDGTSALSFASVADGNYYIAVHHRNHLSAMTANTVAVSSSTPMTDFTSMADAATYGTHSQKDLGSGVYALWAGDVNQSSSVVRSGGGNDIDDIFTIVLDDQNGTNNTSHIVNGYLIGDVNLDGQTIAAGPGNDLNLIIDNVANHPGNNPGGSPNANYVVNEQMP
ncbi:MAG: PA14 domain-containing protein [Chloroflexota bacterium]